MHEDAYLLVVCSNYLQYVEFRNYTEKEELMSSFALYLDNYYAVVV